MDKPLPDKPSRPPSITRRRLGQFCLLGVVLGCLLQLTIRDRFPFPLAGLFYALPRPVILVLAVLGCIVAQNRRTRGVWAAVSLPLALWVAGRDVAWNSPIAASSRVQTVVFWNVGHNLTDDVALVDEFLANRPAILGLVETGPLTPEWLADWGARHAEYELAVAHPGCLLAVRGRIRDRGLLRLPNNSHAAWVDAEIDGQPVHAVVIDVAANPWISRREPLGELGAWLRQLNDRPQIVMGDFNTPDDSVWFETLRQEYREAFRTAGSGYAPTWPWPVPVLRLDQIWVNRFVSVHRAWQTSTWRSDHRPQWVDITWTTGDASSDSGSVRSDRFPAPR